MITASQAGMKTTTRYSSLSWLVALPLVAACSHPSTTGTPETPDDGMATTADDRAPQGNLNGREPSPPAEGSYDEPRPAQGNHNGLGDSRNSLVASQTNPTTATDDPASVPASGTNRLPTQNDTEVSIDVYLIKTCSLDEVKVYFPFDSANPIGGQNKLQKLADCVTKGALKDQKLTVTGYADPRGTEQYNQKLGKSRAESIADVLASAGVPRSRMSIESEGEQQASSTKSEWPTDRRVEITAQSK